jgi:AraC-like DNA-binding protein
MWLSFCTGPHFFVKFFKFVLANSGGLSVSGEFVPTSQRVKSTFGTFHMLTVKFAPATGILSEYISLFYRLETDGEPSELIERADIPHYRANFGGDGTVRFGSQGPKHLTGHYVIGARNQYSVVEGSNAGHVFGFGLLPAGWAAFTKMSAQKCSEDVLPAAAVMPALADALTMNLSANDDFAAMIEKAIHVLEPAALASSNIPFWFFKSVAEWLDSAAMPDLDDLISATGLSKNRTEHLIKHHYGASPSLFIRKCRALRIANRIAHGEGQWQDYIGDTYCDQSHCIREVKRFTGYTPAQLRSSSKPHKDTIFQRRRALLSDAA